MTDRELLEKAAKAAGMEVFFNSIGVCQVKSNHLNAGPMFWNPLNDDAAAFRLAANLALEVDFYEYSILVSSPCGHMIDAAFTDDDIYKISRRAITKVAARIGESKS